MEHFSYEESLRVLEFFTLKKGKLWRDFIVYFQCLKRGFKKDRESLFRKACCDRTKGNGFKQKEAKLRLDIVWPAPVP